MHSGLERDLIDSKSGAAKYQFDQNSNGPAALSVKRNLKCKVVWATSLLFVAKHGFYLFLNNVLILLTKNLYSIHSPFEKNLLQNIDQLLVIRYLIQKNGEPKIRGAGGTSVGERRVCAAQVSGFLHLEGLFLTFFKTFFQVLGPLEGQILKLF